MASEGVGSTMQHFLFTYTHEADIGTTIRLESHQTGSTLNKAWDHMASSFGMGWWRMVSLHAEDWRIAVQGRDALWHPVRECGECAGDGCASCGQSGYLSDDKASSERSGGDGA